ncbi:soma ferritin-like [Argiope bruennichi]|uniref:soma ferritin-like n=1 Tax=Argiope bruennichi TaxID=94029 RepID=UPI00249523E8|nr:soma ferritin-like [Argiope bruennichi]
MADSKVRQNYHEECEAAINKQINRELYAGYVYLSMGYYFDRDDVALPGFSKHFKDQSAEELTHAEKLMKFQNKRGGKIVFYDIQPPEKDDWESGMDALKAALALETSVNQDLLKLRQLAQDHNDPQMCDFLDNELLRQQIEEIKEIGDFIGSLERAGRGLGEYMYDKKDMPGETN